MLFNLDDGIGAPKGFEGAQRASMYTRNTLRSEGFIEYPENVSGDLLLMLHG